MSVKDPNKKICKDSPHPPLPYKKGCAKVFTHTNTHPEYIEGSRPATKLKRKPMMSVAKCLLKILGSTITFQTPFCARIFTNYISIKIFRKKPNKNKARKIDWVLSPALSKFLYPKNWITNFNFMLDNEGEKKKKPFAIWYQPNMNINLLTRQHYETW